MFAPFARGSVIIAGVMIDPGPDPGKPTTASASVSSSLLERLQMQDAEAWRRLVHLYYPLVCGWGRRAGLQAEDAADVAQEVFRALAGNVVRFQRAGGKNSF